VLGELQGAVHACEVEGRKKLDSPGRRLAAALSWEVLVLASDVLKGS